MQNKNKSFNQIILGKLLTQDDKFYINKILTLGAEKAATVAKEVLLRVRSKLGY